MVKIAKHFRNNAVAVSAVLAVLTATALLYSSFTMKTALVAAQSRKSELTKLRKDMANLDAALADRKQYEYNIRFIENSVPDSYHDVAHAVSGLEAIAASDKVKIDMIIDEKSVKEPGGLSSIRIEMVVTGTFANQTVFFSDIANLPFFTRVDSMKFDGEGQLSNVVSLRFFIAEL